MRPHQNSRAGVAIRNLLESVQCRRCNRCDRIKHWTDFHKARSRRDGLQARCIECQKELGAKYQKENRAKVTEIHRKWVAANKTKNDEYNREYRARPEVRAARAAKAAEFRRTIAGALKNRITSRLYFVLRGGKGGKKTEAIVGWEIAELRRHLERQFVAGMTWENMGEWHIDHIVPLSSFQITGPDCPNLRRAWALTNLRPLWAAENIQKSDKTVFLV